MTQPKSDQTARPIIPAALAIKAMRDSGYKNTAHALAELIDNSVQARASEVEVICLEESVRVRTKVWRRLSRIGVLDNGFGMEPQVLQVALQFGNGTHLADRSGIGRFGMGLPNSSISQCRRVDVWTWQSGPDNAVHSYLDVDEVEAGTLSSIANPEASALPEEWKERARTIGTTGTLVVWSKLDDHRITWRGAQATLLHTERIVGRMYRHFIDRGELVITLRTYHGESSNERIVKVNDPLYLSRDSSTPSPFDEKPMFQRWGEADEIFTIDYQNAKHEVRVRISWARSETVPPEGGNRGHRPYGKGRREKHRYFDRQVLAESLFWMLAGRTAMTQWRGGGA